MTSTSGGSFIPKRSTGRVTPVRASKRVYIFSYVAYVLFFGTLLSVVGIFFLNQQADKNLEKFVALVAEERKDFGNRSQIDAIKKLDDRLTAAEQILGWHVAPSRIFEELETVIVKTVQLDSFSYARETGNSVRLEFGGATDSFDALLFQRDAMNNDGLLATASIVNVTYGAGGTVIEGANRSGSQSSSAPVGEAKVTFTFEDGQILEKIGYEPRVNNDPQDVETTAGTEVGTIEILSDGSDGEADSVGDNNEIQ